MLNTYGTIYGAEAVTDGGTVSFGIPSGLADMGAYGLLVTLVAFVLIAIFRGWIVVKLHYDTLTTRVELAEATVATLTATNSVQAQTIQRQTAVGETVVKVMTSVQDARTQGEQT